MQYVHYNYNYNYDYDYDYDYNYDYNYNYNYTSRQNERSVINSHLSLMSLSLVSTCTRSSSGKHIQGRKKGKAVPLQVWSGLCNYNKSPS